MFPRAASPLSLVWVNRPVILIFNLTIHRYLEARDEPVGVGVRKRVKVLLQLLGLHHLLV